ncbi:recombinase family protein [Streptomyces mirabilis]|uniref:recombinase family protein n=1 Tax=Streptomyces mirabilis TaxID=68239 RepID=UPI00364BEB65
MRPTFLKSAVRPGTAMTAALPRSAALSGKRLQRDWRDGFAFLDLAQERNIAVDTIKAGRYNLNTAEGRAQARRAAIDAQEEIEEIAERVRDAKLDNLREGTYRGGPRPLGV